MGGETQKVSRVDALGLRSEVVITMREPPTGDAVRDEYDPIRRVRDFECVSRAKARERESV